MMYNVADVINERVDCISLLNFPGLQVYETHGIAHSMIEVEGIATVMMPL